MKPLLVPSLSVLALFAGAANAQTRPPPNADQAERRHEHRGAFEHDGFYMRFGVGFGGFSEGLSSEELNAAEEPAQGTVTGVSTVGEFMLGGTVAPRFIVGGGVWTSTVLVSDFRQTNGDDVPDDLHRPVNFTIVGPFADWYFGRMPDRAGAGSFHLQSGLGFAVLNGWRPESVRHEDERVALGAGVMVGFGYEWWVHEQWGLGALARFTAAGLVENDARDAIWYHGVATFPSFLFSATYN